MNSVETKLIILVVSHKKATIFKNKFYKPIQVGREGKKSIGYLEDNSGDNISQKNNHYCELTAVYWAWKNLNCEYIGLNHYRRYFFDGSKDYFLYNIFMRKINYSHFVLRGEHALRILNKYDIILPNSETFKNTTVWNQYKSCHNIEDLEKTESIIKKFYPDYIESFNDVMNGNKIFKFNMCITKKSIFDRYSRWLFGILFNLENEIDLCNYSKYQSRVYGFVSERLFNVWVQHNKLKIKHLRVINTESRFHFY